MAAHRYWNKDFITIHISSENNAGLFFCFEAHPFFLPLPPPLPTHVNISLKSFILSPPSRSVNLFMIMSIIYTSKMYWYPDNIVWFGVCVSFVQSIGIFNWSIGRLMIFHFCYFPRYIDILLCVLVNYIENICFKLTKIAERKRFKRLEMLNSWIRYSSINLSICFKYIYSCSDMGNDLTWTNQHYVVFLGIKWMHDSMWHTKAIMKPINSTWFFVILCTPKSFTIYLYSEFVTHLSQSKHMDSIHGKQ